MVQLRTWDDGASGVWKVTRNSWKKDQTPYADDIQQLKDAMDTLRADHDLPTPNDFGLYQHVRGVQARKGGNGILVQLESKEDLQTWRKLKKTSFTLGELQCYMVDARERQTCETFYGVKLHKLYRPSKTIEAAMASQMDDGWPLRPLSEKEAAAMCTPIARRLDDAAFELDGSPTTSALATSWKKKQCVLLSKYVMQTNLPTTTINRSDILIICLALLHNVYHCAMRIFVFWL